MGEKVDEIEAKVLLTVLTAVRDAGRSRRESGLPLDNELILLAARAHAALKWLEADRAGDFQTAERWLDVVYGPGGGKE